jgi:PAS domain S-box-containing protein
MSGQRKTGSGKPRKTVKRKPKTTRPKQDNDLSEIFEALKRIASGDPLVKISETSETESIAELKRLINETALGIGEIIDQSHEFAMGLAEHFDVLHRVSKGELDARVSAVSGNELLEALKKVTNETIGSIDREITDRKKAEEALSKLEALESSILSAIPHAVIGLRKRKIIFANEAVESVFGWRPEELLGRGTRVLYRTDREYEEIGKHFYPVLEGQKTYSEEFACRRKDGSDILCKVSASVIGKHLTEQEIVVIYEDITERKQMEREKYRLEEQLFHALKMEAVGQLAGGIAHDFNNMLTAIIGYGSLLNTEVNRDARLSSYVRQILSAAERAAHLTNDLLTFSRKQIINPTPVNLEDVVKEVENLLSRVIGEDVELSKVLTNEDLIIMADSSQIGQVLMNLATNARDAMPDGGSLIISTSRIELDKEFIKTHGYGKAGPYALLSFEDTGQGMDEKIKERIFEPFFTTKGVGKGTGLGLAMVYGIIKQHGGYINVYSEPGSGTTFKMYFPLAKSKVEEVKPLDPPPSSPGWETIMIVEDDVQVRNFMKEVLLKAGYSIIEAVDGEDALRVFHDNKDGIHLLLLDVIMPRKNGKDFYDEIKKTRTDMKVIFVSGYSAHIIYKQGILEEGLDFMSKPVQPEELLQKVRSLLDA